MSVTCTYRYPRETWAPRTAPTPTPHRGFGGVISGISAKPRRVCHPGWGTAGWAVRRGAGSAQIPAAAAGSGAGGGGPLSEGKVTLGDAGEEGGAAGGVLPL